MKKIGILLACAGALAFPAASLAGNGSGGAGLQAHLARATAKVAKYDAKCHVASPAANCSAMKAKLTAKFDAWDAKIQAQDHQGQPAARQRRQDRQAGEAQQRAQPDRRTQGAALTF